MSSCMRVGEGRGRRGVRRSRAGAHILQDAKAPAKVRGRYIQSFSAVGVSSKFSFEILRFGQTAPEPQDDTNDCGRGSVIAGGRMPNAPAQVRGRYTKRWSDCGVEHIFR